MAEPIVIPDRLNMVRFFLDDRIAEGRGDDVAIVHNDVATGGDVAAATVTELTYRELVAASCRVTNLLRELGLRIEDRVQLLLLDTPEFAAAYFGVLRAGCIAVPTNTWLLPKDYSYYLEYARPRAVIVDAEVWPALAPVWQDAPYPPHVIVVDRRCGEVPDGTIDWHQAMARSSPEARTEETWRDDFATWLSSSGSTGNPKCVMHMHHDFMWNTIAYAQRTLGLRETDVTLSAPKLFFGYALASNLLFPLSVGGRCVLTHERLDARDYLGLVCRHGVTQFVTVPTNIAKLVALPHDTTFDLSSLHSLVSAGEALPPRIYRDFKQRYGVEIYDGIGSAEMFHVYITNRPGDVKEGSLGRIVEGYRHRLVDDANRDVAEGEIGTLVIEGPSAGAGYWRLRDRSRETFWGDAVKCGDKFHVDAEGYFWYCGRGDDMLKCSGVYVSPVEVENCLLGHPAVLEAGVVGYRDETGLEKAMAFVELHDPAAASDGLAAEIIGWARDHIAAFKVPRRVVFGTLPRTETGKIRRAELRTRTETA